MNKNNKPTGKLLSYNELEVLFDEMSDYLSNLIDEHQRTEEELRYCSEFIGYKKLEDEFYYFKENAHEEYPEDMPFPSLTL